MWPPGAIRWSQGMLLLPQHFQQSDLYNSAALRYAAGVLHPFPWGVRVLRIDDDALETDVLRVKQCEAIFPDGTVVRHPEGAELKEASFKDTFALTMETLGVWLSVPALDGLGAGARRYADRPEERVQDLFDGGSESPLVYIVPRAELLFSNDPEDRRLSGYQRIKIAELRRTSSATQRYELSRKYIPPLVSCAGSPLLMSLIRQVHERVCGTARVLSERRLATADGRMTEGSAGLKHLIALLALGQFAPAMQHRLTYDGGHPLECYELLVQLRGMLSGFGVADVLDFPKYEHTDLAGCFQPVVASILDLLPQIVPTDCEEVPLQRDSDLFFGELEERLLAAGAQFILAVRGPGPVADVGDRVLRQGKIGLIGEIDHLRNRGLTGVPRRLLDQPPAEIPRSPEFVYFSVETGDARWRNIREEREFAFDLTDAEPGVDVKLYVVLSKTRQS